VVRADSAFYSAAFIGPVRAAGVLFSVTVAMNSHVRAAIADIRRRLAAYPIPLGPRG
jgi:hypothetical protein